MDRQIVHFSSVSDSSPSSCSALPSCGLLYSKVKDIIWLGTDFLMLCHAWVVAGRQRVRASSISQVLQPGEPNPAKTASRGRMPPARCWATRLLPELGAVGLIEVPQSPLVLASPADPKMCRVTTASKSRNHCAPHQLGHWLRPLLHHGAALGLPDPSSPFPPHTHSK